MLFISTMGQESANPETDNDQRYAARLREVRDFIEKVSWSAYLNSIQEKRRNESTPDSLEDRPALFSRLAAATIFIALSLPWYSA